MKILTTFDHPPIPTREMDWSAIDEDTYGGEANDPIGRGRTPLAAVEDLLEQLEPDDYPTIKLAQDYVSAVHRGDSATVYVARRLMAHRMKEEVA